MANEPSRRAIAVGLAATGLVSVAAAQPVFPTTRHALDRNSIITRLAFGSCNNQRRPQSHWAPILRAQPQALILMGDNVYGDLEEQSPAALAQAYRELAASPDFQGFAARIPIMATWDDHDYGANDAGAMYAHRADAQRQFLDFWGAQEDDPRRGRDGIYDAYVIGPEGRRVQIILLDLRSFRSEMIRGYDLHRNSSGYAVQLEPGAQILGDAQWAWLADQLRQPAEVRLLVSSLQVIGDGGENWKHLPLERRRLFDTIQACKANGLICLSGDVHTGAMYRFNRNLAYPFYEFTSSSLNQGPQRVAMDEAYLIEGGVFADSNFGLLGIDWDRRELDVQLRALTGEPVRRRRINFSELQIGT